MANTFTSQVMAALGRLKLFLTAQLPASPPTGLLVYDTTTDGVKVANNAGVFTAVGGGGGGVTIGAAVTGGVANGVLYEDAAQNVKAEAAFTYDETTNLLTIDNVITASGTEASPSVKVGAAPATGIFRRGANLAFVANAAASQFEVSSNASEGARVPATLQYVFTSGTLSASNWSAGSFRFWCRLWVDPAGARGTCPKRELHERDRRIHEHGALRHGDLR
jgi:hypothetical protein